MKKKKKSIIISDDEWEEFEIKTMSTIHLCFSPNKSQIQLHDCKKYDHSNDCKSHVRF